MKGWLRCRYFQAGARGLSCTAAAAYPARGSVLPGVGELRRPDQSQDFLSPRKPIITRVSASVTLAGTNRVSVGPGRCRGREGGAGQTGSARMTPT